MKPGNTTRLYKNGTVPPKDSEDAIHNALDAVMDVLHKETGATYFIAFFPDGRKVSALTAFLDQESMEKAHAAIYMAKSHIVME